MADGVCGSLSCGVLWRERRAVRVGRPFYVTALWFAARESQAPGLWRQDYRPSAAGARKPARLQSCKFAIVAQRRERAVDRLAQGLVLLGKRDPEFLMRRHLDRDRQCRTILHQPRDHRMKLDHEIGRAHV